MNKILKYINNNDWKTALKKYDPFEIINGDKNIFHYACLRGNKYAITHCMNIKNNLIYLSDINGNTGAHLLAMNNFHELLIELVKSFPKFLILHNNILQYIHNIVYNDYNVLNKIIDIIIKNKYTNVLSNKNMHKKSLYHYLFDMIESNKKFTKILDKIWNYVELPMFYAKYNTFMYIINNYIIDINMKTPDNMSILLYLIKKHQYNIIKFILKKYRNKIDINTSGTLNTDIPLIMLIKDKQIELISLMLKCKNINFNLSDDNLNIPIYYLIKYIYKIQKDISKKEFDNLIQILKIFIKNSDLMTQNIKLKTPYSYLIKSGLWKYCKDELKDKKIDLYAETKSGKNIISTFSSDEESDDFKNSVDLKSNSIDLSNVKIVLPNIIENNINGINTTLIFTTLYLSNFMEKYNIALPIQIYNDDKYLYDEYMLSFNNKNSTQINDFYVFMKDIIKICYCFYPAIIFWKNKHINFVHPDINMYIDRTINMKNVQFVVIWLTLILDNSNHANIIIYDKINNTLLRFEPYGTIYNFDDLDNFIIDIFKKSNLKFTYSFPKNFLSKVKFQEASKGDHVKFQNIGDPPGYCLAWCIWFLELKILNANIIDNEKLAILALQTIISKYNKIEFSLLHYIRGYSNYITEQSNNVLDKLHIDKYKLIIPLKSYNELSNYLISIVDNFFKKNITLNISE